MSVFVRTISAALLIATFGTATAYAGTGTALTEDQAKRLDAYMKQASRPKIAPDGQVAVTMTVPTTPALVGASDQAVVAGQDTNPVADAYLALSAPATAPAGLTYGIAAGLGIQPALPELTAWDKDAAAAVVAALKTPKGNTTADEAATYAATPALDPAFEERVNLVRDLFRVDGTEELIRHFVATEHMKLIVQEVARHIDFNKLSQTDKVRLASIVTVVQTELQDRIVLLNARLQAGNLSKPEILQLIAAFNIDPQRKLTQMRLNDDGKIDRAAELDLRLAQYQIVKQYEAGH